MTVVVTIIFKQYYRMSCVNNSIYSISVLCSRLLCEQSQNRLLEFAISILDKTRNCNLIQYLSFLFTSKFLNLFVNLFFVKRCRLLKAKVHQTKKRCRVL